MKNRIIARTNEIATLERKYRSDKSEFVMVYGRRRIGKTFLVNCVFADRFTFAYVGARKQNQKEFSDHDGNHLRFCSWNTLGNRAERGRYG